MRLYFPIRQESPFGAKLEYDVFLIMHLISAARYTNAFILSYTSRKYAPETKQQIIRIREDLEKEDSYFIGSEVVRKNYENQTGKEVSKSYVDSVLKEAGLVRSPAKKEKGRSKYMKYPAYK